MKNVPVTVSDETWRMDTDAFLPDPAGYIKLDGQDYAIFSYMDIPLEDSLKVLKLSDDIEKSKTADERFVRTIEQLLLMNGPEGTLKEAHLRKLKPRQLITLAVYAMSIAVPQKAGEEKPSESASSAPAPAGSTDGAIAS